MASGYEYIRGSGRGWAGHDVLCQIQKTARPHVIVARTKALSSVGSLK